MTRVGVLGAAYSANRGAASMLKALVENLPDEMGPCTFLVFSTYPEEDREALEHDRVVIHSAKPAQMPWMFLGACLTALGRRLAGARFPSLGGAANRTLDAVDLVVDLAGISFVDGRGVPILAYNVMMTGVPLLLGKPTVKASQAIGPFQTPLNRTAAKAVLPRLARICARGSSTAAHLAELNLPQVTEAADLAFSMRPDPEAEKQVAQELGASSEPLIGIVPSEVVNQYCIKDGPDYVGILAEFTREILGQGMRCVLFPHSARPGRKASRMNDQPLCRAIAQRVGPHPLLTLDDRSQAPETLRAMIERCDLLVTSRFHAMISALATATPVLVIGWSHKYREVLADFELEEEAIGWEGLDLPSVRLAFDRAWERRARTAALILKHLPSVVNRSRLNYGAIASVHRSPPLPASTK